MNLCVSNAFAKMLTIEKFSRKPFLSANANRFFKPDKITSTQRGSCDVRRSQNGFNTPAVPMRYEICCSVPLDVTLVITHAASFCDRYSPPFSTTHMSSNSPSSITAWICVGFPAVILLMVHAASFTILLRELCNSLCIIFSAFALITASVYHKNGRIKNSFFLHFSDILKSFSQRI